MPVSVDNIRSPLEIALFSITPAIATAWENQDFSPPAAGTPWQEVKIVFNEPDNSSMGVSHYQERGVMMVALHYPASQGAHAAQARAELIRTKFARGATFANGGVTTLIEKTPRIGAGMKNTTQDEWVLPVTVRFKADMFL